MALTTRVQFTLASELTNALDLGTVSLPVKKALDFIWSSGTGANAADRVFADTRTVAASSNDSLDLAGSLSDGIGGAFTPAKIKGLIVYASPSNTNNVVVTRPASNGVPLFSAAGDAFPLRPGALLVWLSPDSTGVAVTAGTGDLLDFTNSGAGTGVTYDLVILGTSA